MPDWYFLIECSAFPQNPDKRNPETRNPDTRNPNTRNPDTQNPNTPTFNQTGSITHSILYLCGTGSIAPCLVDARTNNHSEGIKTLSTLLLNVTVLRSIGVAILCWFNAEAELKVMQTSTGLEVTKKTMNKTVKQKEGIKRTVMGYHQSDTITIKLIYTLSMTSLI